jgi:hypothetical protein
VDPMCLHEALNCSVTATLSKAPHQESGPFSWTIQNKKQTAFESDMSERNLQNHRTFVLSIINTRLATEVRIRHLGRLETHEAECLS